MTSPQALLFNTHYHIFNRGTNGENLFYQERNYEYFMNLYTKYIDPVAETFAYILLRNHFHILLREKSEKEIQTEKESVGNPNPGKHASLKPDYVSQQFSRFFNAYAKAINTAQGRSGSLFEHPFRRVAIKNERQFWRVIAYIHQNPQKHHFVDDFREWKWSSYGILPGETKTTLSRQAVLDWFGGRDGYVELHRQWVEDGKERWSEND